MVPVYRSAPSALRTWAKRIGVLLLVLCALALGSLLERTNWPLLREAIGFGPHQAEAPTLEPPAAPRGPTTLQPGLTPLPDPIARFDRGLPGATLQERVNAPAAGSTADSGVDVQLEEAPQTQPTQAVDVQLQDTDSRP